MSDLNQSLSPQEDYDNFVNSEWKNNNPIPGDYSRWTSFHVLHEKVREQLKEICQTLPAEGLLGSFYHLAIPEPIELSTKLKGLLSKVAATQNESELFSLAGQMFCEHGVSTFFHMCKGQDDKNPQFYIPHLMHGGLSLPDRDYYLEADKVAEFREDYLAHVKQLMGVAGVTEFTDTSVVWEIEKKFAELHLSRVQQRDPHLLYNKMAFEELRSSRLSSYFAGMTFPVMTDVLVDCPNFFQQLHTVWDTFSLNQWKLWISWKIVRSCASHETEPLVTEMFNFWSKRLSGQKEQKPRWKKVLGLMGNLLGEELGKTYVERYFPAANKTICLEMIERLREALREKLTNSDWMSEETKKEALLKLNAFKAKIGYPDKWLVDYTNLKWQGCQKVQEFLSNWAQWDWQYEECNKFYSAVEPEKWYMSPQDVNAYYNPPSNEIVFPAGILQEPFFNPNWDLSRNMGGIGVVIGHEMTHGFDDQGRKYNSKGELQDWWTEEDTTRFTAKANVVRDHFDGLTFYGKPLNGKLTLGENIADIGGLKLALRGFTDPVDLTLFFMQYATVWRCNITEQEAHRLLAVDPHSPGHYRINAALAHIPEFQKLYKVKPGDRMYRTRGDMMSIW